MGRFFTTDEVLAKHVPTLGSFYSVVRDLKKTVLQDDQILAAMVYGSSAYGSQNIRSDIDCLIIYDWSQRPTATINALRRRAAVEHIQLNITCQDNKFTEPALTHIRPIFLDHLKKVPQHMILKGDPLGFFHQGEQNRVADVLEYIRSKVRMFEELELVPDRHDYTRKLQKMMDTPVHVARKILYLICPERMTTDHKLYVGSMYSAVEELPNEAGSLLRSILGIDAHYTRILEDTVRTEYSEYYDAHGEALLEVEHQYDRCFEFVRSNGLYLASKSALI